MIPLHAGEERSVAATKTYTATLLVLARPSDYTRQMVHNNPDLAGEIEALEEGRDPYARRPGHLWRILEVGRRRVPARIYVPGAVKAGRPLPLVVALHGAETRTCPIQGLAALPQLGIGVDAAGSRVLRFDGAGIALDDAGNTVRDNVIAGAGGADRFHLAGCPS